MDMDGESSHPLHLSVNDIAWQCFKCFIAVDDWSLDKQLTLYPYQRDLSNSASDEESDLLEGRFGTVFDNADTSKAIKIENIREFAYGCTRREGSYQ